MDITGKQEPNKKPTVSDPAIDPLLKGQLRFDQDGTLVGVQVGDTIVPIQNELEDSEFSNIVNPDFFINATKTILDHMIKAGQVSHKMRTIMRKQIDEQFQDSWFSKIRAAWEKAIFDRGYHRAKRDERVGNLSLIESISQAFRANVAIEIAGMVELARVTAENLVSGSVFAREFGQYKERAQFDSYNTLAPTRLAYGHEITMANLTHDAHYRIEELKLNLETARLDSEMVAADKDREVDITTKTMEMGTSLQGFANDIRLLSKELPEERLLAALNLLGTALSAFDSFAVELDPKSKARLAPGIQKMILDAMAEAMKAVRRG